MQVGLMAPQGWKYEYNGWDPAAAWARTLELAAHAEATGFESLWVFDHFTTVPEPLDEICLESFTVLGALAHATRRVRIGHMVICNGFRNPALTAKMGSTLDVLSGGRFELGIGAGWKEDEWRAYGYGFPTLKERMDAFGDGLEVISRMFGEGRATYHGEHASVKGAINVPKGIQRPIPIVVGGNGENVTFRYAAKFAAELNLVFLEPERIAEALPVIRSRCEEIGRDPASLRVSLYCRDEAVKEAGQQRVDFVGELKALGLARLVAFPTRWSPTVEAQESFAADCRAAGIVLGAGAPA